MQSNTAVAMDIDLKKEEQTAKANDEPEVWKPTVSHPKYKVSSLGRYMTAKGHISKSAPKANGYITARLFDNEDSSTYKAVHILVAEAFIPNPDKKPMVNHVNGIRHDNRVDNLEWVTCLENAERKVIQPKQKKGRKIIQYTLDNKLIKIWDRAMDAGKALGVNRRNITYCCQRGVPNVAGFIWRYHDEVIGLPDEEWLPIIVKGTHTYVSSHGRIIAESGEKTYGSLSGHGYMYFGGMSMHRLVCMAFQPIDNPEDFCVDHIDGDKTNNKSSNLRWATVAENNQYAHDLKPRTHKNQEVGVAQYSMDGVLIKKYESLEAACQATGVFKGNLSSACRGNYKFTGGFKWKYLE